MRLTRLEMHGFKSFADRTDMRFESGVTAIVGPNGCGKSNVSDAVRWVLGEQRARLLRGAKMEEVIFQGSSARRPVNIAEVSLVFDNSDGQLPIAYREVVITRRLSRSGESDYLLNGTICRLRDIQDLVRGTGLGADSGVVIEAKMIDALLSDRPDERRELFEEAAGVSLYRDRRRSTERRLEETAIDLSRLDDLVNEVHSQVRSLARQRRRAERHAELTTRRFQVELTLASRDMSAWRDELVELDSRVGTLREAVPAAETRVQEAERGREAAHYARAAAEAARAELARATNAQQQELARVESELAVAEERHRNAIERRQRAEEERRAGTELGARLQADRRSAADDRTRIEGELEQARAVLASRVAADDAARARVVSARAEADAAERGARELRDRIRHRELDRESAAREGTELEARTTEFAHDRDALADNMELQRAALTLADREVERTQLLLEERIAALESARAAVTEARGLEHASRQELLRAEDGITSLEAKLHALEALERERVGLAPAAAKLLDDREEFGEGAVLGPLSDFVSTSAESALLLERYLGANLHAILVRDSEAAEQVRVWHARTNPGPLLLLPLDVAHAPADDADEPLVTLADVAESAREWLRVLLHAVRPLGNGEAFVDGRGAMWLPGNATGRGPLRRRAELRAVGGELQSCVATRTAAAERAEAAQQAVASAERAMAAAAEAATAAQEEVRATQTQHEDGERRLQRAQRELENVAAAIARIADRRTNLFRQAATIDDELGSLADQIEAADQAATDARTRLAAVEHDQEEAREARTRGQVEEARIAARLQVAADREHRLAEDMSAASGRLEALMTELADIAARDSALAERMAAWTLDIEARREALIEISRRLVAAEDGVRAADAAFESAERRLDEARLAATTAGDALHHAELRFAELSGKRTAIRERLEAEWRRPLDVMLEQLKPLESEDAELRAEMEALRTTLNELGQVNPLAIEEHDEEVRRLDFLTSQRDDLSSAKHSLQQAIREIDVTARELFLATFHQVRENFRNTFVTLFGGGECDLRLENPETPLDCDIEIHAAPRGKRTQRIHLLSSGERALVALSLLFGIFLTKPSPFCLLDEVDAPLDDQNVGRFVRMLEQFKSNTQFIVITHNPRTTTEAADAVYGVTMQEPGVSSLVSVRMRGSSIDDASLEGAGSEAVAAGA
ncbi:MAG TPA: chromosome segregation protein SMC [Gemmatimonadaceae bacterium]|nr:chromosome segregation protein SMC [Gemmatimonadaceae bacterium]